MAAPCCPACKRALNVVRTEACGAALCSFVGEYGRFKNTYNMLPSELLHIEAKKRGIEAGEGDGNRSPWPQSEFETAFNQGIAKLITEASDERYQRIFLESANRREFGEKWIALVLDSDRYRVVPANRTPNLEAALAAAVTAVWAQYTSDQGLDRIRAEARLADAARAFDRAQEGMRSGVVPPADTFAATGPAHIREYEPFERLAAFPEATTDLEKRWAVLVAQRNFLASIDQEGLAPFFRVAANLFAGHLKALPNLLGIRDGRAYAGTFISSPEAGAAIQSALTANLGPARGERIVAGMRAALTQPEPVPGLAEEMINGLVLLFEEVRKKRYDEIGYYLLPRLAAKIKELSIRRGGGRADELRAQVVDPFFALPAGETGRYLSKDEVDEIISDAINLYARAAKARTKEEKAKIANPDVAKEATVEIAPVEKKRGKKASKYRTAFLDTIVELVTLEPEDAPFTWTRLRDAPQVSVVNWLGTEELPKKAAQAVGIPDGRYIEVIVSKAEFLAIKIKAALKRFAKEEKKALAEKTREEKALLKEKKIEERKAAAAADKAERERERAQREKDRTTKADVVMKQIEEWPENINLFIANPQQQPPESRAIIDVYKTIAENGGNKGDFQAAISASDPPGSMPLLPNVADIGIVPHNLAWARLELSALGLARRTKVVKASLDKMNFEVFRSETLALGLPDPDVYDAYMDGMAKINNVPRTGVNFDHERPQLDPEKPQALVSKMYKLRTKQMLVDYPIELVRLSNGAAKEAQLQQLGLIAQASLPVIEQMVEELRESPANRFQADKALVELEKELDDVAAELDDGKISANRIEGAFVEAGRNNPAGFKNKLLKYWRTFDSQYASSVVGRDTRELLNHKPAYVSVFPRSTLETEQGKRVVGKLDVVFASLKRAKEPAAPGVAEALMAKINRDKEAEREYLAIEASIREKKREKELAAEKARQAGLTGIPKEPPPPATVVAKRRITPVLLAQAPVPNLPGAFSSSASPAPIVALAPPRPSPLLSRPKKVRASSDLEDEDDDVLPPAPAPAPAFVSSRNPEKAKEERAFDIDAKEELEDESIDLEAGSEEEEDEEEEEKERKTKKSVPAPPPAAAGKKPVTDPLEAAMRSVQRKPSLMERMRARRDMGPEVDSWTVVSKKDEWMQEMTPEESAAYWAQATDPKTLRQQKTSNDLIEFNM